MACDLRFLRRSFNAAERSGRSPGDAVHLFYKCKSTFSVSFELHVNVCSCVISLSGTDVNLFHVFAVSARIIRHRVLKPGQRKSFKGKKPHLILSSHLIMKSFHQTHILSDELFQSCYFAQKLRISLIVVLSVQCVPQQGQCITQTRNSNTIYFFTFKVSFYSVLGLYSADPEILSMHVSQKEL